MTTAIKDYLDAYDFNLPLEDALNDRSLSADRRAMAALSRRQCLRDGLMSVTDLKQTFEALVAEYRSGTMSDSSPGSTRINEILREEGDDYQRRIYFIVSEQPVTVALEDLAWLETLMRDRFDMYAALKEVGVRLPMLPGTEGATMGTPAVRHYLR